jgi:hypothetical protein
VVRSHLLILLNGSLFQEFHLLLRALQHLSVAHHSALHLHFNRQHQPRTPTIHSLLEPPLELVPNPLNTNILVVGVALCAILITIFAIFVSRRRKYGKFQENTASNYANPTEISTISSSSSSVIHLPEVEAAPLKGIVLSTKIGQGNFATVYKGSWGANLVACKVLKNKDQFYSFKSEAATLKNLSHPNIVTYYGTFQEQDQWVIVTEFCDMGSLDAVIHCYPEKFTTQVMACTYVKSC